MRTSIFEVFVNVTLASIKHEPRESRRKCQRERTKWLKSVSVLSLFFNYYFHFYILEFFCLVLNCKWHIPLGIVGIHAHFHLTHFITWKDEKDLSLDELQLMHW